MYIDTRGLKRIISEELDKKAAKRKQLKLELENLEEQQITLRHNLEQICFVEDLAHSFHTVVEEGVKNHNVYQIAPEECADEEETMVLIPEKDEAANGGLIKRLMEDELRIFTSRRKHR